MKEKKIKARSAVALAVAAGRLLKGPCAKCGTSERVEGHHEDYDKPLEVIWLCRPHHNELHIERLQEGVDSLGVEAIKMRLVWVCRHCKHEWLAGDVNKPPKQCPNRDCRAMDWNRKKIKEGRPRKGEPGRPKFRKRGKR